MKKIILLSLLLVFVSVCGAQDSDELREYNKKRYGSCNVVSLTSTTHNGAKIYCLGASPPSLVEIKYIDLGLGRAGGLTAVKLYITSPISDASTLDGSAVVTYKLGNEEMVYKEAWDPLKFMGENEEGVSLFIAQTSSTKVTMKFIEGMMEEDIILFNIEGITQMGTIVLPRKAPNAVSDFMNRVTSGS